MEELWRRCREQASEASAERPMLRSIDGFRELYEGRRQAYAKASLRVETFGRTVDDIAAEIAATLKLKSIELRTEEGEVE
jgi:shikimate kinase